jgi:hypothetical protein
MSSDAEAEAEESVPRSRPTPPRQPKPSLPSTDKRKSSHAAGNKSIARQHKAAGTSSDTKSIFRKCLGTVFGRSSTTVRLDLNRPG